jgi:hypothetical protein
MRFMTALFSKRFIVIAVALTIVFLVVYIFVQQAASKSTNNHQIKIAKDSASVLAKGEEPDFLRNSVSGKMDIAKSQDLFLITFDGRGVPLASTAVLDGKIPAPSEGVFAYAKKNGQNKINWEPKKGVRIAAVVVYYGGSREGYALAGRSLLKGEGQIGMFGNLLIAGWVISLFIAFFAVLFVGRKKRLTQ